jgi:hypothetical protein
MLRLEQNAPNPFNPSTRISFSAPRDGRYRLSIQDVTGREVRLLFDRNLAQGPGSVLWDGRTDGGARVASGVYVCTIEGAAGERASRRMILLK